MGKWARCWGGFGSQVNHTNCFIKHFTIEVQTSVSVNSIHT